MLEKEIAAAKANLDRVEQRHQEEMAEREANLARYKVERELEIKVIFLNQQF